MPAEIALLICTSFVLFLLRLDRKQYTEASFALWIPTIWMLMNSSKPLAVWFNTGGAGMEAGSPFDRNVLSVIGLLGIIILAKRRFKLSFVLNNIYWAFLLICFMLASTFWSDMLIVSLKRWAREVIVFIMAFVVLTENDPKKSIICIFRRIIYILVPFSYLLINYFPYLGREYARWSGELMWIGVTTQKNGLATLCLLAILFIIWGFLNRYTKQAKPVVRYQKYVEIFLLLISLWLFGGPDHTPTYSATATSALIVGLITMGFLFWVKRFNVLAGANTLCFLIGLLIIIGTITPFAGGFFISDIASTFNRDESLTGRADIWAYLLPYANEKLILGHGFGGFWTDAMRKATSSHAHNGALDTILHLGMIGHIFFTFYLISSCHRAAKMMNCDFGWGCFWVSLLFTTVVHNIAESTLTSFSGLLSASLLFLLVSDSKISSIKES